MPTLTHYITLDIAGHACEQEVTLSYSYERACGDGWNEPREPAGCVLESVEVWYQHGTTPVRMDVYPLLTKECISDLEHWLLEEHEEAREPEPDLLREVA